MVNLRNALLNVFQKNFLWFDRTRFLKKIQNNNKICGRMFIVQPLHTIWRRSKFFAFMEIVKSDETYESRTFHWLWDDSTIKKKIETFNWTEKRRQWQCTRLKNHGHGQQFFQIIIRFFMSPSRNVDFPFSLLWWNHL